MRAELRHINFQEVSSLPREPRDHIPSLIEDQHNAIPHDTDSDYDLEGFVEHPC